MPTQIILLERVDNLGAMGDVVSVKSGYARNFLLPHAKALRATKENVAYFEAQKASLQKANGEKKAEAEKVAKSVEAAKVVLIRQASESGHLYGSVASRDIAAELADVSKQAITRGQVVLNQNIKTIGLFNVDVVLHPEVKIKVSVNVARSAAEAEVQAKTGKAVIADNRANAKEEAAANAKAAFLDDSALANEAEAEAHDAEAAAHDAEKAAKKAAKKSAKKTDDTEGDETAE